MVTIERGSSLSRTRRDEREKAVATEVEQSAIARKRAMKHKQMVIQRGLAGRNWTWATGFSL